MKILKSIGGFLRRRTVHFFELLGVQALAAVPGILASPAVRSFIDHHPWAAAYAPVAISAIAVGVADLRERLQHDLAGTVTTPLETHLLETTVGEAQRLLPAIETHLHFHGPAAATAEPTLAPAAATEMAVVK